MLVLATQKPDADTDPVEPAGPARHPGRVPHRDLAVRRHDPRRRLGQGRARPLQVPHHPQGRLLARRRRRRPARRAGPADRPHPPDGPRRPDAASIERARQLREDLGTLTGVAAGEAPAEALPDRFLDDVLMAVRRRRGPGVVRAALRAPHRRPARALRRLGAHRPRRRPQAPPHRHRPGVGPAPTTAPAPTAAASAASTSSTPSPTASAAPPTPRRRPSDARGPQTAARPSTPPARSSGTASPPRPRDQGISDLAPAGRPPPKPPPTAPNGHTRQEPLAASRRRPTPTHDSARQRARRPGAPTPSPP